MVDNMQEMKHYRREVERWLEQNSLNSAELGYSTVTLLAKFLGQSTCTGEEEQKKPKQNY